MAKINSINNQSGSLTIDPGASGDSFIQFDINTTGEFIIGVDDSDSDKFKIQPGSALTAAAPFEMDANGILRMEDQPAFLATNSATDLNVTGDGTEATIDINTEVFDQNADFAADTFTAPVTGRYYLSCVAFLQAVVAGHTSGSLKIVASNRTYEFNLGNPGAIQVGNSIQVAVSTMVDMDATDTATVTITISGGAKDVDVFGAATDSYTSFSGALLC